MKKDRVQYIDIAKGIGIICVIVGHMSIGWINMIVYTFHLPLFFIIAGYLMKKKETYKLVSDKLHRLLLPYILTCICIVVGSVLVNIIRGRISDVIPDMLEWIYASLYGSGNTYVYPFYIKSIGAIWFLPAMFAAVTIYNFLMDQKYCTLKIAILALTGYTTSKYIYLPWSIQSACVALVFVHLGYLAKNRQTLESFRPGTCVIAAVCWFSSVIINKGRFYLVGNYSENLFIDIIGGAAGSYLVLGFSKILERVSTAGNLLAGIGRNSLIILCVHIVELNIFPWRAFWKFLGVKNESFMLILLGCGKVVWYIAGTLLVLYIKEKINWRKRNAENKNLIF